MLTVFFNILLLAACAIAGPVPRNQKRQSSPLYANTTIVPAKSVTSISSSSVLNLPTTLAIVSGIPNPQYQSFGSSLISSSAPAQTVKADTAVVIEPIQRTVFTRIIPPITFLNPKGEPIASEGAQTILSTSFFTPTAAPVPSSSAKIVSSESRATTSFPEKGPTEPISSQAAIQSGATSTRSIPSFSYAPEESESVVLSSGTKPAITPSSLGSASLSSTKAPTGNASSLPEVTQPGLVSAGTSIVFASSVAANQSSTIATSVNIGSSTAIQGPPSPTSLAISRVTGSASLSRIIVTKTEYTTLYRSTLLPAAGSASSSLKGSELGGASTSLSQPPPLVIVTQYTTITPSPAVVPSQLPNTSALPGPAPSSVMLSSSVFAPSSAAAAPSQSLSQPSPPPPPSSSSTPGPISSSKALESPTRSSSSTLSPLSPPPVVTQLPSAPPPADPTSPPPNSAATSEGPLIINPIPPSQIFTVTVTSTEKETVTETATVSVTVRA